MAAKVNGQGTNTSVNGRMATNTGKAPYTYADGRVKEGIWEYGEFKYAKKTSPVVIAKKTPKPKPTKHVDQQKRLELTRRTQEALKTSRSLFRQTRRHHRCKKKVCYPTMAEA